MKLLFEIKYSQLLWLKFYVPATFLYNPSEKYNLKG